MSETSSSERPPRLLDQVRAAIRYKHYSLRTEQAYVYWIRYFIRQQGMRHPREMGVEEVQSFLSWLADDRSVAPSTHNQALSALLFLYKQVLNVDLPWMQEIGRPKKRERVPVVLSRGEAARVLNAMEGAEGDLARLLYGTGMRLMEGLRLRVKDVDFERNEIVVREGSRKRYRRSETIRSSVALPRRACESWSSRAAGRAILRFTATKSRPTPC